MEEARADPEAVMVDTRAVATAAMMHQANVAVVTAGEVAGVVGTAATPAEVAIASSSHSTLNSNLSQSSRKNVHIFIIQKKYCDIYVKEKIVSSCI
jgi:septal ring-binding cell division protein DamX